MVDSIHFGKNARTFLGGVTGAIIGLAYGGPAGAVVGVVIGGGLGAIADKSEEKAMEKDER